MIGFKQYFSRTAYEVRMKRSRFSISQLLHAVRTLLLDRFRYL